MTVSSPNPTRVIVLVLLGLITGEFSSQLARRLRSPSTSAAPGDVGGHRRAGGNAAGQMPPRHLPVVRLSGLVGDGHAGILVRRWLAHADDGGFAVVIEARNDRSATRYERAG